MFAFFIATGFFANTAAAEELSKIEYPLKSYKDLDILFNRLDYTSKAWKNGIRSVPRLYLENIPSRWRGAISKEISVKDKKRFFFRLMAPLVLTANELISADRAKLLSLSKMEVLGAKDQIWLVALAKRYKVATREAGFPKSVISELTNRVDVIPVSLALSQSAEESGWGTSRFADLGNAVFGQWTWGGKGIKPKQQRKSLGNYKIASFDSILDSVKAYMRNINTNAAYKELRDMRAQLRKTSQPISGWKLAEALSRYSERGLDYIKSLHTIMRVNKLAATDDAVLVGYNNYILIPVGEGNE